MSKTPDTTASQAQWLSPIVKKRKVTKKTTKTISTPPLVSPLSNWLRSHKSEQRRKIKIAVPARSFKSQVSGYHDIPTNPTPGDLVMSTAEEMNHPAYTMKESIGAKYIFFGKVKYFIHQTEAEGVRELLSIDWNFIVDDPRKYEVPPILSSKVKFLSKRNSYDLENLNDFLKDAVHCHWELDRVSGWEMLV